MEEDEFTIPNLEDIPFSIKILFLLGILFAFMSPNMTPWEMIGALVIIFAIFVPLFLADLKAEINRNA